MSQRSLPGRGSLVSAALKEHHSTSPASLTAKRALTTAWRDGAQLATGSSSLPGTQAGTQDCPQLTRTDILGWEGTG